MPVVATQSGPCPKCPLMISWVVVRPQIRNPTTRWDHRPHHRSQHLQQMQLDQSGSVEGLPGHCLPLKMLLPNTKAKNL